MSLIRDYPDFRFKAPNGVASRCRIRLYSVQGEEMPAAFHRNCIVVIATQLEEEDNVGMSVTNAAEAIATLIVAQSCIEPMRLIWIEHYSVRGRHPETFNRVLFETHHNSSYGLKVNLPSKGLADCGVSPAGGPWILRRATWTHRIPREFICQLVGEEV